MCLTNLNPNPPGWSQAGQQFVRALRAMCRGLQGLVTLIDGWCGGQQVITERGCEGGHVSWRPAACCVVGAAVVACPKDVANQAAPAIHFSPIWSSACILQESLALMHADCMTGSQSEGSACYSLSWKLRLRHSILQEILMLEWPQVSPCQG